MVSIKSSALRQGAVDVIQEASLALSIRASSERLDNYDRVWARDLAVTGLAVLNDEIKDLYPALRHSLLLLQGAAAANGQIPSNVHLDNRGSSRVSFGRPVGRTDTSFWWIIVSVLFLQRQKDEIFEQKLREQCHAIYALSNAWEFNGKHLMYVPMSGNWADEYITHGYVLYDQILRYWALSLAGDYFKEEIWQEKALKIKVAIKQHFLFEAEFDGSLFTGLQRERLADFDLSKDFLASFSPGDWVRRHDFWSIALLFLLKIPSERSAEKLVRAVEELFLKSRQRGLPAFWPVVAEQDPLYDALLMNHRYRFKNKPGHFHNGGVWPVVNGFLIAGLIVAGRSELARKLFHSLHQNLGNVLQSHPFVEYFDLDEGQPQGVSRSCFSASAYLIAQRAVAHPEESKCFFQFGQDEALAAEQAFLETARKIFRGLALPSKGVFAISIAGESGSGKTSLSLALKRVFEESGHKTLILHQDNYFRLPPRQNHHKRLEQFSWIGPGEVRLDWLDQHIRQIKAQEAPVIDLPLMDWVTDTEGAQKVAVEGVNIVLVDGTYSSLLQEVDYRIFLNSDYKQTRKYRIKRNRETVTDFIERVLERESQIIQAHQKRADLIIDGKLQFVHPTPVDGVVDG